MTGVSPSGRPGGIVLVNNSMDTFTPTASGAIATWVWEVARVAAAAGDPVRVVTRSAPEPAYPLEGLALVGAVPGSTGRVTSLARRASRRATGFRRADQRGFARAVVAELRGGPPFATVVCHNDPELAVVLAGAFPDRTIVHWFHNPVLATDRWRRRYRTARVRSVAVSAAVARSVELLYELGPDAVATVLNGVDATRFNPALRGHGDVDGPVTIGFVGRTGPEKGADLLLEACLRLARSSARPPFAVRLVGSNVWGGAVDTPYARRLAAASDELRRRGVPVTATGHLPRDAVPGAIARTDVHVLPSRWDEPCSLSLLEGMAAGCAVVATATGGTPEVLAGAGVLVPRDDVDARARALGDLVGDHQRRSALGSSARRRAEELPWAAVWDALGNLAPVPGDGEP
jgi:glycosyltransferase involved in cell wall biosynthesis